MPADPDFGEELKQTAFPDLLDGADVAPYIPKKKKKKEGRKGRVVTTRDFAQNVWDDGDAASFDKSGVDMLENAGIEEAYSDRQPSSAPKLVMDAPEEKSFSLPRSGSRAKKVFPTPTTVHGIAQKKSSYVNPARASVLEPIQSSSFLKAHTDVKITPSHAKTDEIDYPSGSKRSMEGSVNTSTSYAPNWVAPLVPETVNIDIPPPSHTRSLTSKHASPSTISVATKIVAVYPAKKSPNGPTAPQRTQTPTRCYNKMGEMSSTTSCNGTSSKSLPGAPRESVLERRALQDPPALSMVGGNGGADDDRSNSGILPSRRHHRAGLNESGRVVQRQALAVPEEELYDSECLSDENHNHRAPSYLEGHDGSEKMGQRQQNSPHLIPTTPPIATSADVRITAPSALRNVSKRDFLQEPGLYSGFGEVRNSPPTIFHVPDEEEIEVAFHPIPSSSSLKKDEPQQHDDTSTTADANSDFSPNNQNAVIEVPQVPMCVDSGDCSSTVSSMNHMTFDAPASQERLVPDHGMVQNQNHSLLDDPSCTRPDDPESRCNEDNDYDDDDDDAKISTVSDNEIDNDNDDDDNDEVSQDAAELLERAHDRIARQQLQDQVHELQAALERKNVELEALAGQLRRAIETKCDLVVAHNELEQSHERMVQKKNDNLLRLREANKCLLEGHAATEKKMLNELMQMEDQLVEMEQKHQQELDDWERMHRNEMLEKDFVIAKLQEELRGYKLPYTSANGRPELPIL